jgi:hypothetical protein
VLPAEPNGANILLKDIFRDLAIWQDKMFETVMDR